MRLLPCGFIVSVFTITVLPALAKTYSGFPVTEPREIHGGRVVDHFEQPFNSVVYINSALGCTGVLVRPLWVLTTAHCVEGGTVAATVIEFGWVQGDTSKYQQQTGVVRIITHPQYRNVDGDTPYTIHDVALIRLREQFHSAQALSFSSPNAVGPTHGSPVLVAGWGLVENDERPSNLVAADWVTSECQPELISDKSLSIIPFA